MRYKYSFFQCHIWVTNMPGFVFQVKNQYHLLLLNPVTKYSGISYPFRHIIKQIQLDTYYLVMYPETVNIISMITVIFIF